MESKRGFFVQMNLLEATPPIDPLQLYTLKVERLEHENDCFQDRFISFSRGWFSCSQLQGSIYFEAVTFFEQVSFGFWIYICLTSKKNHFHFWPADLKALLIVFSFNTGMRKGHGRLSAEIQAAVEKGVDPIKSWVLKRKKENEEKRDKQVQVLQSCDWTRAWRNCWECQAMCNALSRVFARWWWRCCCGPLWDGSLVSRYASSIKCHFRDWDWREDGRALLEAIVSVVGNSPIWSFLMPRIVIDTDTGLEVRERKSGARSRASSFTVHIDHYILGFCTGASVVSWLRLWWMIPRFRRWAPLQTADPNFIYYHCETWTGWTNPGVFKRCLKGQEEFGDQKPTKLVIYERNTYPKMPKEVRHPELLYIHGMRRNSLATVINQDYYMFRFRDPNLNLYIT